MYGQSTKWTIVRAAELVMDKNPPTGTYNGCFDATVTLSVHRAGQSWRRVSRGERAGAPYHPNELEFMFLMTAQVSYSNLALFMLVECVEAKKYPNAIVAVSE